MTNCELCRMPARTYCESDQASLCWECDAKVHGANFLVARHLRTLLCHACQSHTPWKASGVRFGNTVSICEACAAGGMNVINDEGEESEAGNDDDMDTDDDLDDDDDQEEKEEDVGGDELDGDNDIVPWSSTPPPAAASSSSSEESISRCDDKSDRVNASGTVGTISLKRRRENISSDVNFKEGQNCSSSNGRGNG